MSTIPLLPQGLDRRTSFAPACHPPWDKAGQANAVSVPGLARNIQVKIASTRAEWEEAFELVADNYQARGYEAPGSELRFTSYHALPSTVVLVAKTARGVAATFSLVADNHLLGLPLERVYGAELRQLRGSGRRIVETTSLADRDLGQREFVQVFQTMMQVAFQYGVLQGVDTNVIAINPRHCPFYSKLLGYAALGPRRAYPQVRGAPAEALFLDIDPLRTKAPALYQRMFGRPLPADVLRADTIPPDLVRQFAQRSSQTNPCLVEEILRYVADWGCPRRW
jgi:hypothetical protein